MPKRRIEDDGFNKVYKKLKKKLMKDILSKPRRRRLSSSSQDSESHSETPGSALHSPVRNNNLGELSPTSSREVPTETVPSNEDLVEETSAVKDAAVANHVAGPVETPGQPNIASEEETVPDLDPDILDILGVDPTLQIKYAKAIQKDVAVRLEHTATAGLSKDDRKELTEKYILAENCKLVGPPALNAEIKAALTLPVIKRDRVIEGKQKLLASAISGLGAAITIMLSEKGKNNELLRQLIDTARIMCDCQHNDTATRRTFIMNSVKPEMRESLQSTKVDDYLFGHNLPDTLKTAKLIHKSGTELKQTVPPKPSTSYGNNYQSSKNWKPSGRKKPPPQRQDVPKQQTTAGRTLRANSYRPSGSQRAPATTRPPPPPPPPTRARR